MVKQLLTAIFYLFLTDTFTGISRYFPFLQLLVVLFYEFLFIAILAICLMMVCCYKRVLLNFYYVLVKFLQKANGKE